VLGFNWWKTQRRSRAAGAVGAAKVEITPAGFFSSKADVGESRRVWSSIDRIEQTPQLVLVYVNHFTAMAIPKRAFASPAAVEAFVQAARDWHRAAVESKKAAVVAQTELAPSAAPTGRGDEPTP
jgi:hypothetical protein